jgi:hypothetical protein
MSNILDELIRIGAFKSKGEARNLIKNNGVSIIPCINEDYEVPCFEIEIPGSDWENMDVNPGHYFIESRTGEKQLYYKGYILEPNYTKIPAKMWDVRDINLNLLSFREHLMNDNKKDYFSLCISNPKAYPKSWQNGTMCVITWDKKYGKNPWLVTDMNLDYTIKSGDVIRLGKKSIIVE